jgi:hypothetical protein
VTLFERVTVPFLSLEKVAANKERDKREEEAFHMHARTCQPLVVSRCWTGILQFKVCNENAIANLDEGQSCNPFF